MPERAGHVPTYRRFTRGKTPIRPQRPLHGWRVTCSCGDFDTRVNGQRPEAVRRFAEHLSTQPAPTPLTEPQRRVLDYLYRAGWASERAIARMLYDNPRQKVRAAGVVGRLRDKGLAETYLVHRGAGTAWHLTDAGKAAARETISGASWPEVCPDCGAPWALRSKTMGAAFGQPHEGRCQNGHAWYEDASAVT